MEPCSRLHERPCSTERIQAGRSLAESSGNRHQFRKVTARELGIRAFDDADCKEHGDYAQEVSVLPGKRIAGSER